MIQKLLAQTLIQKHQKTFWWNFHDMCSCKYEHYAKNTCKRTDIWRLAMKDLEMESFDNLESNSDASHRSVLHCFYYKSI